jgi:hypothetical protein
VVICGVEGNDVLGKLMRVGERSNVNVPELEEWERGAVCKVIPEPEVDEGGDKFNPALPKSKLGVLNSGRGCTGCGSG